MMAPTADTQQSGADDKNRPVRVYGLLVAVIFTKPISNLFLAWGMRHFPDTVSANPLFYVRAIADPLVATGICMQIVWLLMRMALLSVADLSFVLPVTAVGYVLSTFLAQVFLHEQISTMRWMGTGVIFLGTALVSCTLRAATTPETRK